jgi:hypothetical protein
MSSAKQSEPGGVGGGNPIWQSERVRRLILYAVVLLVVFLAGLVPMWIQARERTRERYVAVDLPADTARGFGSDRLRPAGHFTVRGEGWKR